MTSTVLVTGAAEPAAVSLLEDLREEPLRVMACDMDPDAPGMHVVEPENRFVVHDCDSPEYVGDLLSLCERCHVDVLVPAGESCQLFNQSTCELFQQLGTRVVVAGDAPKKSRRRLIDAVHARLGLRAVAERIWGWLSSDADETAQAAEVRAAQEADDTKRSDSLHH